MCRYAHHIYKAPYACFKCRKMFKQTSTSDIRVKQRDTRSEVKCPQCKQLMKAMGHDFKTPKQNDLKQWKKVEILFEHGFKFGSCGCGVPGYRPATLQEVDSFLAENLRKSERQKSLEKMYQTTKYRRKYN